MEARAPCCVYGGAGSYFITGEAVAAVAPSQASRQIPAVAASDGSSMSIILLGGSSPDESFAGWLVFDNAVNNSQILRTWTGDEAGVPTACREFSTPISEPYVASYAMCTGQDSQ